MYFFLYYLLCVIFHDFFLIRFHSVQSIPVSKLAFTRDHHVVTGLPPLLPQSRITKRYASSALALLQRFHPGLELLVHRLLHDLQDGLQITLVALAGLALDVLQQAAGKLKVTLRGGVVVPAEDFSRVVEDLRGVGGGGHVLNQIFLGFECA